MPRPDGVGPRARDSRLPMVRSDEATSRPRPGRACRAGPAGALCRLASRSRRPAALLALLALASWTGGQRARADTITYSQAFHLDGATPSAALDFDLFPPALGTLRSVEIAVTGVTLRHQWWLWEDGDSAAAVEYAAVLQGAGISVADAAGSLALSFDSLSYQGTTPTLNPVPFETFLGEAAAALAGGTVPAADAFRGTGSSGPLEGQFFSAGFTGELRVRFDPGWWTLQVDRGWTVSTARLDGTAAVIYDYAPATVPDSLPVAGCVVLGGVLLVVGAGIRKRDGANDYGTDTRRR